VIVLDTHAWLWWLSGTARLGRVAGRRIDEADTIGVPAICCFEVAAAVHRGRLALDRGVLDWLDAALATPRVALLPLTPRVAVRASSLIGFHGDPADRLIVATALEAGSALVTRDGAIRRAKLVETVW
jgi:PIN domain nuclease of toxin-antitoxin system